MSRDKSYASNLAAIAKSVRTGPFSEMRAATLLTPDDLRAGAARCERDAQFRRCLADRMEQKGVASMTVRAVLAASASAHNPGHEEGAT